MFSMWKDSKEGALKGSKEVSVYNEGCMEIKFRTPSEISVLC